MRRNQGGQKYKYIALSLSLSCESDFFILLDMSKENIKTMIRHNTFCFVPLSNISMWVISGSDMGKGCSSNSRGW